MTNHEIPDEPKMPFDECMTCEKEYSFELDNTYIFEIEDFPDAEHLATICPHCKQLNIAFLGGEETRAHYAQFGYGRRIDRVPQPDIMENYLSLYEIPLIQEQELTPRQEAHVKYLGHLLTSDYLTPKDFDDGAAGLVL